MRAARTNARSTDRWRAPTPRACDNRERVILCTDGNNPYIYIKRSIIVRDGARVRNDVLRHAGHQCHLGALSIGGGAN